MKRIVNFKKSHEFSKAINNLIPAGAHTYSKGDDQFPYNAPKGIKRGKGVRVWDVDDNEYIDWAMGLTSVSLGHAYEPVLKAVRDQLELGANFQRPATIELEFAELLKEVLPNYDMFKFAKNGSTVTTAAVKLARAYTGREKIAICAEQPFFSYDDWFIGSTVCDKGIPNEFKQMTVKFNYNSVESVERMIEENPDQIACLTMEAAKFDAPQSGFLKKVQNLCKEHGIVFILDEMITGFRFDIEGAAKYFDLDPDITTYGKAIGNGFSVAVLAGKREVMELGSIIPGTERVFLTSTTHGSETHGLAAAIATIKVMKKENVIEKNWEKGRTIIKEVNKIISDNNLSEYMEIVGFPCWPLVNFKDHDQNISMEFKTLFLQEMISRGILFQGTFTIAYEHQMNDIEITLEAFDESCKVYKKAIENKSVEGLLVGPAIKPVFRSVN